MFFPGGSGRVDSEIVLIIMDIRFQLLRKGGMSCVYIEP
jgi:hypothetical protein